MRFLITLTFLTAALVPACSSPIQTRTEVEWKITAPQFTQIGDLKIRYRLQETPGKPFLIMTNAWPQSIRCWDSQWESLAKNYSLLAYDMPGFGLSPGKTELMNPPAQGEVLLQIAQHFGIKKFTGVGPDVGAPVLLWLVQNYPENLEGIVVFAGPGYFPPDFSWQLNTLLDYEFLRDFWTDRGGAFGDSALENGYKKYVPASYAVAEYRKANANPEEFRHTMEFIASYPEHLPAIGDALKNIRTPVLILWGAEDAFVKVETARKLGAEIDGATVRVFAGAGHFLQEDLGDEFGEVLDAWVRGLK